MATSASQAERNPPVSPSPIGFGKSIIFALVPVVVLMATAECLLRWTGAADTCWSPLVAQSSLWECDPLLHFRMKHDLDMGGERLNREGFRGREFGPKPPDTFRILTLGDSCTLGFINASAENGYFVDDPYPELLERRAQADGRRVEVLNAGVAGYTSYQGIMLLRTRLGDLAPDLITVRYGWNDLMSGSVAPAVLTEPATKIGRWAEAVALQTALYPFALRLNMWLRSQRTPAVGPASIAPAGWTPSVPLERYQAHLRRIVEWGHSHGAAVWLLTAPHALLLQEYGRHLANLVEQSTPQLTLVRLSGIRSVKQLVVLRERYNTATQEVGRELGVPIVDVAQAFREHSGEHLFAPVDVIHPNQRGHALEADVLYRALLADPATARAVTASRPSAPSLP